MKLAGSLYSTNISLISISAASSLHFYLDQSHEIIALSLISFIFDDHNVHSFSGVTLVFEVWVREYPVLPILLISLSTCMCILRLYIKSTKTSEQAVLVYVGETHSGLDQTSS